MELEPQEFLVKDANKVQELVEKYIGVESKVNNNTNIIVFGLNNIELKFIKRLITDNDLWIEPEDDDSKYNYSYYPTSCIENV